MEHNNGQRWSKPIVQVKNNLEAQGGTRKGGSRQIFHDADGRRWEKIQFNWLHIKGASDI